MMVRLICDTRMRIGSLLLRAGVASEPMSEEDAERLIAKDPLARLWRGGPLKIIPADQVEVDAEAALRAREERIEAAARAAFDALRAAEDPERAKDLLDQLWRRDGLTVEDVVRMVEQTEALIESLTDQDRARLMELVERRHDGDQEESDGPPAPADPPPAPPVPLDKITIPQATPVIAAETDLEVLQAWRELDERKGIHELIDARLEELTAPPAPE